MTVNLIPDPARTPPCPSCREARDAAVENWLLALSFWEVNLVRRCFNHWRNRLREALARALSHWLGATTAGYFRYTPRAQRSVSGGGCRESDGGVCLGEGGWGG